MKKCLGFCFLLFFSLISPGALELELSGGLGNMAFDGGGNSPVAGKAFVPNFFPYGRAMVSGETGANIFYNAGYERDSILKKCYWAVKCLFFPGARDPCIAL